LINKHINPHLGDYEIEDINRQVIDRFLYQLFERGVGTRTIHYVYSVLRTAFNYALSIELIKSNKIKQATLPQKEHNEMKVLDQKQIGTFLQFAKSSPYYVLFFTAINTGMRISELLALKWDDIDFQSSLIHVQRQVKHLFHKNFQFSSPKTKYGVRNIPISSRLSIYLDQYKHEEHDQDQAGDRHEDDLVFTSTAGTIVTYSHLRRVFKRILLDANLPNLRLHDLRHTCATLLIENRITITTVSRILGHSKPSVTLDFYGHLTEHSFDEIKKIMELM
jgi:integrase